MSTEKEISIILKSFQLEIDNAFWILQIKCIGLYEIRRLRSNYNEKVGVTRANDVEQKIIHVIEISTNKLKSSYSILETEMRRAFISDLYVAVANNSILIRNVLDKKIVINSSLSEEKIDKAPTLLYPFLKKEDKEFLNFFHKIRNSVIHYDGNHNKRNSIDYKFGDVHFFTTEVNHGKQIEWGIDQLIDLYHRVKEIFCPEIILNNHFFKQKLSS